MTAETQQILEDAHIDTAAGIEHCSNDEALFLRMLHVFAGQTSFSEFVAASDRQDWQGAYEALHDVKGVSGLLGSKRLYELCEAACDKRHGRVDNDPYGRPVGFEDSAEQLMPELVEAYREVISAIGSISE